jgi:hypothetical protein
MNRSIRHGGENEMNNNANIGEAYRNQLYNQMSLIPLERYARAEMLNEGNERTDEDERQDDTWDPMQDEQFSDDDGAAGDAMEDGAEDRDDADSGLPRKYRNKMKRYIISRTRSPRIFHLGLQGLSMNRKT